MTAPDRWRLWPAFDDATLDRFRLAAERLLRHPFRAWFYGDSIGFEGLVAASEMVGDSRFRDFVHGFLRGWAARDEPRRPDDNTAPGQVLAGLAATLDDSLLRDAAIRLAEHLAARRRIAGTAVTFEDARRAVREPYGPVALPPDERAILAAPGPGIYVDCLHFDPPFYALLARLTGDTRWATRAIEEALGYGTLLRDESTRLYRHFWLERTGRAYGPGWGRGQGWAFLGLLDVLERVPEDAPGRAELADHARALAGAMLDLQRPDGGWWAVVDVAESGDETSTAAFMAAGFLRAIALGLVPANPFAAAAERAWQATWAAVDETGLLTGVSAAVYSSTRPEHYHHVPRGLDVPWGQGPLLVAALERARARSRPSADIPEA